MRRTSLAAAFAMYGAMASALGLEVWEETEDWKILILSPDAGSCVAHQSHEGGLTVEIGAPPGSFGGYFAAYNPAWTMIEEGATGIVKFDFGEDEFAGEAIGVYLNGTPGGQIVIEHPSFRSEFGRNHNVVVTGESGNSFEVDLSGAAAAIEKVIECQTELSAG